MKFVRDILLLAAFALALSIGPTPAQHVGSFGGTPITGVFSGADTTTASATLTGVAGKTTYICGFQVSGLGATAAAGTPVSVATLVGGNTATYYYSFVAGAALANPPLIVTYSPCVPASAVGANIVVTVTGAAGNTATAIVANGYLY